LLPHNTWPCRSRAYSKTAALRSSSGTFSNWRSTSSSAKKLNLADRNDPVCGNGARKIIEIGSSGVINAVAIAEIAYRELVVK
jgi:hypothetical protein